MAKRTEREFHIALGKLLDRVRIQNSWSRESFYTAATHVANISSSEAIRFFKALVEMNFLQPASDRRKLSPNFDTIIWKNEDKRIGFIKEILEICDVYFIDGNHENFKYLYSFPEENWGGGVIHRITDNIIHLNTSLSIDHIKDYKYNTDIIISLNDAEKMFFTNSLSSSVLQPWCV